MEYDEEKFIALLCLQMMREVSVRYGLMYRIGVSDFVVSGLELNGTPWVLAHNCVNELKRYTTDLLPYYQELLKIPLPEGIPAGDNDG